MSSDEEAACCLCSGHWEDTGIGWRGRSLSGKERSRPGDPWLTKSLSALYTSELILVSISLLFLITETKIKNRQINKQRKKVLESSSSFLTLF